MDKKTLRGEVIKKTSDSVIIKPDNSEDIIMAQYSGNISVGDTGTFKVSTKYIDQYIVLDYVPDVKEAFTYKPIPTDEADIQELDFSLFNMEDESSIEDSVDRSSAELPKEEVLDSKISFDISRISKELKKGISSILSDHTLYERLYGNTNIRCTEAAKVIANIGYDLAMAEPGVNTDLIVFCAICHCLVSKADPLGSWQVFLKLKEYNISLMDMDNSYLIALKNAIEGNHKAGKSKESQIILEAINAFKNAYERR